MARATSYINYQSGHGYSNEEIIDLGNKYSELGSRDIEELRKVGINQEFIQNLNTKIAEFKAIPTELEDREAVKKTTRDKNIIKKYIEEKLITVKAQVMFYLIINKESTTTFRNPIKGKKDLVLTSHVQVFSQLMSGNKIKFNSYGVSDEVIDEVATFHSLLLDSIVVQNIASKNKIRNSSDRSDLKAEIYAICKHISTLGKLTWQQTDELKYKDYLITKPKKRGRKVGSKNKVSE